MQIKLYLIKFVAILVCFTFFCSLVPPSIIAQARVPAPVRELGVEKYALLIGIGDYKSKDIPNIEACANNILLMRQTLADDFGFQNILILQDQKATREAILSSFKSHLIENARAARSKTVKEAAVVFYFCGYGSRAVDINEDEPDGLDETLVAFDSRSSKGDILDDEIDANLSELTQFTRNAALIFEASHEYQITRESENFTGASLEPSSFKAERTPAFLSNENQKNTSGVIISAALGNQRAYSERAEVCKCKPYSLMTKAFVEALKRASQNTSYRELIRDVITSVAAQTLNQTPSAEGDLDRPIFGGTSLRLEPSFTIASINSARNEIVINAGRVHGVRVGSIISFYSPQSRVFSGGEGLLANAVVAKVSASESVVRLSNNGSSKLEIPLGAKAVLNSASFGGEGLLVDLRKVSVVLQTQIKEKLEDKLYLQKGLVKLREDNSTTQDSDFDAILTLQKGKLKDIFPDELQAGGEEKSCAGINNKTTAAAADGEVYYFDEGDGKPVFGQYVCSNALQAAYSLTSIVASRLRQINLLSVKNDNLELSKKIRISIEKVTGIISEQGFMPTSTEILSGEKPALSLHATFRIIIENFSNEKLYVMPIMLSNTGGILPVLDFDFKSAAFAPNTSQRSSLFLTTKPFGLEYLKVFVSRQPIDFSFLETSNVRRNQNSALEKLLSLSGSQRALESDLSFLDELNQWSAINYSYEITSDAMVASWNLTGSIAQRSVFSTTQLNANSLVFSPDGKILAAAGGDGAIYLWDSENGEQIKTLKGHTQSVESVAFSPDGKLLASASADKTVKIWEVATDKNRTFVGHVAGVNSVAFSPDGKLLASASADKTVRLWKTATGETVKRLTAFDAAVNSVAFSPNNQSLATGDAEAKVKLWNIQSETMQIEFSGHTEAVNSVAFNPNGDLLASGSNDGTVKIWDIPASVKIQTLVGSFANHASAVNDVKFSPDGRLLASGSYDQTIRIRDVASGKELWTLKGQKQPIAAIAFSPDGKTIVGSSIPTRGENPMLHVLAIGLNTYQNLPQLKLAVKDAQDFTSAIKQVGRAGGFERINATLLTDAEATKQNIIAAINNIAEISNPEDTFVFYFSGMGSDKSRTRREFSLLPYDFTRSSESSARDISASALSTLLNGVEAKQQLIVFDAAFGDLAFEAFQNNVNRQKELYGELFEKNLILLSASGAARENGENGVFTSLILSGLRGAARIKVGENTTGDGLRKNILAITGKSLMEFLQSRETPETKFKTFSVGKDFVLGGYTQIPSPQRQQSSLDTKPDFLPAVRFSKLGYMPDLRFAAGFSKTVFQTQAKAIPRPTPPATTTKESSPANPSSINQSSSEQRKGKNYALLIGVDNYDSWEDLKNPIYDAESIEKELKEVYGFETTVIRDATKKDILDALKQLKKKEDWSEDDQLLIFFAGHGYFNDDLGKGFIITKESMSPADDEIGQTFFQHDDLKRLINNIGCKHILLILDSCFSGTIDDQVANRGNDEPYKRATNLQFIRRKMKLKTRRFITSGGKNYVSDGIKGKHSPFVAKFLEALRNYGGTDGILTRYGLLDYMQFIQPPPHENGWGDNEPGSDFVFEVRVKPQIPSEQPKKQ